MKKTVTVGLAALNEENNIITCLEAIVSQVGDNFELKEIIVASDGSTDKTVELAQLYKDKQVRVLDYADRKGQLERLKNIISDFDSDIIILTDADTVFENQNVVSRLVKKLTDNNASMVCGRAKPLEGKTFVEKSVRNTHLAYEKWALKFNDGNNVFNVHGCIMCLDKNFIKSLEIPQEVSVFDVFVYYSCIWHGKTFKFEPNACALIRVPDNLRDHIKQTKRYVSSGSNVESHFDKKLIEKELAVPKTLKYRSFLSMLIRHPISCTFIYVINKCVYLNSKIRKTNVVKNWDLSQSTKKGMNT